MKAGKDLQKKLNEGFSKRPQSSDKKVSRANPDQRKEVSKKGAGANVVKGYKMEEIKAKDETTDISSSGVQWFASLFVVLIIGLAVYGAKRNKRGIANVKTKK